MKKRSRKKNTKKITPTPDALEEKQKKPADDSRRAVGALLGFYRRIKGKTQAEIAVTAGLKSSALGMFESGLRLPNPEAVSSLAAALDLDAFQLQQLQFISAYSNKGPLIGEQWFLPSDVLNGVPVFLRNMRLEVEAQKEAAISEMWIVASRPLAIGGEFYEVLKGRLLREETKYVYFIDSTAGESPIRDLWSRLSTDAPELKKVLPAKLRCVLVPPSLCLFHYGICNPGQLARMFGRLIVYASGLPVGYLSMDSQQVLSAYQLLAQVFQRLQGEKDILTDYGRFREVTATPHDGTA